MKNKDNQPGEASSSANPGQAMRRQAEAIAREQASLSTENLGALSSEETRQMLNELRVHQIEVEMQNEELRRVLAEVDAERARYFDLYDLAPVGYCTVSEKGLILEVNLTAATLLGAARNTLLKQPISRFIHKKDQDIYYLHRKQLFETGEPQVRELRMVSQDGKSFWARLEATVVQNTDDGPLYRVVMSDITESKRTEAALRESEANLLEAQKIARMGRWELDLSTGLLLWSDGIFTLFEVSRETFAASYEAFMDFVHPDDRALVDQAYRKSVESKEPYEIEHRLRMKDGRIKWVSEIGRTEYDDAGNPIRSVGIVQDITERHMVATYREMGREVLQILNEPGDMHDSIQRVITVLKTRTGFDAVGIRLQDGDDFPYFAQEGFSKDFLLTEDTLIERFADGGVCRDKNGNAGLECTCGLVISGKADPANPLFTAGGSFWTNDSSLLLDIPRGEDPRLRPRNQCIHQGYASVALVPIRNKDRNIGLIQFNDRRKGCFTLDTIERLEGTASHIGEALMRKRTEEALRETQAILKASMDNNQVGIAIADAPSGTLRYVNDAGLFIRGGDRRKVVNGVGIDQYVASWQLMDFDGRHLKSDEVPLARAIMYGETCSREFIIRRTTDDDRIVLAKASPIWDDNGKVIAGVVAFMDITERKKLEVALQKAYDDLEKQVKERTIELANALEESEKRRQIAETAFSEIKKLKDQLEAERAYLLEEIELEYNHENIIGQSDGLKYVLYKIEQIADSDTTVLVLGETGTGKELIARAIHSLSSRKNRSLVKVNCAALPPNLIENELFGHEKGSFTGSHSRSLGRFEVADGTTLFLDEIGELPLELQPKLLRVLQDGEFERVGSSRTVKVDVRIVAATNRNLEEEVRKNNFREDLWYRLNVFPITMPPLRDRLEDIPLLVKFYVKKISRRLGKTIEIIPVNVMEALQNYHWPGNVRELENVLERGVITSSGTKLRLIDELKKPQRSLSPGQKTLEAVERDHILQILEQTHWKIGGKNSASEILGLNRSTLRARMRKLDIQKKS
ncbi:MAG: sigma 54-interacting transcriptional regulator [Desulfobacterales bacterium]